MMAAICFLKFQFSLERSNAITGNKTISCFSWSGRFILSKFEKMSARYPSLNHHILSVNHFFSHKNEICSGKKVTSSACNSNNCISAFPQDSHYNSVCRTYTSCILLPHRIQKYIIVGWLLTILIIFTASSGRSSMKLYLFYPVSL